MKIGPTVWKVGEAVTEAGGPQDLGFLFRWVISGLCHGKSTQRKRDCDCIINIGAKKG